MLAVIAFINTVFCHATPKEFKDSSHRIRIMLLTTRLNRPSFSGEYATNQREAAKATMAEFAR